MTEPITTIALPYEKDAIAWLRKATSNDPTRPVLDCISKQGSFVVSTDGFRAHFIEAPECMEELPDTNEDGQANYRVCESAISWEMEARKFPSVKEHSDSLLPEGEPKATFRISPRFLIEALEGFVGDCAGVLISVYDEEETITIQSNRGDKRYAVIKGIYKSPMTQEEVWKPDIQEGILQGG